MDERTKAVQKFIKFVISEKEKFLIKEKIIRLCQHT